MATYHLGYPQEKVYLHFDKPHYVLGDKIWLKAYLVDAILHTEDTPSGQVIVELISPTDQILTSLTIKMEPGEGAGVINIGPDWQTGNYLIRGYTNYQRNFNEPTFFEREIVIYDAYSENSASTEISSVSSDDASQDTDNSDYTDRNIFFFPEGGDLISGFRTKVGVNAFDQDFDGVGVQGEVLDQSGNKISEFETDEQGLASFEITPELNQSYSAKVNWQGETIISELPAVLETGYTMKIIESADTLRLTVFSNDQNGLNGAFIASHLRGQLFAMIEGLRGNMVTLKVPLSGSPNGVLHFTLFDATGSPRSERLVFIYREEDLADIQFSLSKQLYAQREEVNLELEFPGESDSTFLNGSLTISELGLASPSKNESDIRTFLLLESDLKGKIPAPGYFFDGDLVRKDKIDLLMLTHGWRRFEWPEMLANPEVPVQWYPEYYLSVKGYTTRHNNPDKRIRSRVFLSQLTENFMMVDQVTDENGYFEFYDVAASDSIPVLLQAEIYNESKEEKNRQKQERKKNKNKAVDAEGGPTGRRYVDIHLDPTKPPEITRYYAQKAHQVDPNVLQEYFMASRKTNTVDSAYQILRTYELEEVVIQSEKIDPVIGDRQGILYKEPDRRLVVDSTNFARTARSIFELIRGRFPGVSVVGSYPNYDILTRGNISIQLSSNPIYLLDGSVVDVSLINLLPVENVAFVDVLTSLSKTVVYGSRGAAVVAVYTKTPEEMPPEEQVGSFNFYLPGYHNAEIFKSPDYGKNPKSLKPDFRTTLFWEPNIYFQKGNKKNISFYTSDKQAVYSLRFEGVTSNGIPVVYHKNFEVR